MIGVSCSIVRKQKTAYYVRISGGSSDVCSSDLKSPMPDSPVVSIPSLAEIEAARARLGERIVTTPIHVWRGPEIAEAAGAGTEVVLKLELWQQIARASRRERVCRFV